MTSLASLCLLSQASPNPDQAIQAILAKHRLPGVSVAAMKDGKTVYAKGFGFADLENKSPMTADSVHELASVSKTFTAVATLLLVQEGKFGLDDPVGKHVPEQAKAFEGMTIAMLLNHTSGVGDYLEKIRPIDNVNESRLIETIAGAKPSFPAGTKFEYSNSGYALLGIILSRVSGTRLAALMKEKIYTPAGMTRTRSNDTRAVIEGRAQGYTLGLTGAMKEGWTSPSMSLTADGHVMSTAKDLMLYAKWVWSGPALTSATRARMLRQDEVTRQGKSPLHYGCGWMIVRRPDKRLVVFHNGGWEGTSTVLVTFPEENSAYAVLINSDTGAEALQEIGQVLEKALLAR